MYQHWYIEGEMEITVQTPPLQEDRCVRNRQWWCRWCGRIWAHAIYLDVNTKPEWQGSYDIQFRSCPQCGQGDLLDLAILSRIRPLPIPQEIYLREIKRGIEEHVKEANDPR